MPKEELTADKIQLKKICKLLTDAKYDDLAIKLHNQNSGPLVENIKDHPEVKKVTFLYYDEKETCSDVYLNGMLRTLPNVIDKFGPPTKAGLIIPMDKVKGTTNLWTVTVEIPTKLCVGYDFKTKEKVSSRITQQVDPLNPQAFSHSPGRLVSVFDLSPPKEKPQKIQEILKQEGRLKRFSIDDEGTIILRDEKYNPSKNERIFTIHFPQEYSKNNVYPMRLFLDGRWYLEGFDIPSMPDKEPTINIMLEPKPLGATPNPDEDREQEYEAAPIERFATFVHEIFLPRIQKQFNTSKDPQNNTICGSSLSGFAAAYLGLHYPKDFGNVLSQSGAFQLGDNQLYRELNSGTFDLKQLKKSRFCLEVGSFEKFQNEPNKNLAEAMDKQGIPSHLTEVVAVHSDVGWAKRFKDLAKELQEMRKNVTLPRWTKAAEMTGSKYLDAIGNHDDQEQAILDRRRGFE